ncbi:hypothetical protein I7I51_06738 [Histoplasma capsulatum]|uniref:Decapping enzyme Dcp1 n=1 Tax=Ajellomyces capsulatus TaxID=5037 RepID=A0A8A1MP92_AJECA|nr:conserved hypothetical protein [Histoplasma mississippiense (nom. inval.)]EDN06363.1 conserved hypothetical protein [Histoplasma mississippiense (nom. inval.)]QSS65887.1 hypothetical protein I7I51_06738 [Histoplasma capsulatum]
MTLRRGQSRRNNVSNSNPQQPSHRSSHNRNPSNLAQPSDYESDIQNNYISDTQIAANGSTSMATDSSQSKPPTRTNEELNLAVLRRHYPDILSILSLAPYAVVYNFSATTQLWEKSGIEGTMFVCQLTQGELGEERYSVLVLNRRGMQNFEAKLADGDDVEITDEYVILKVASTGAEPGATTIKAADGRQSVIYGLWIFSEPPPSSTAEIRALNAQIIKECAVHGGESKRFALERVAAERNQGDAQGHGDQGLYQGGVPMGRQISLKELFGQQRKQDDEWSVKVHSPRLRTVDSESQLAQQQQLHQQHQQQQQQQPQGGQDWPTPPAAPPQPPTTTGNDVLGALFRKAYQSPAQ